MAGVTAGSSAPAFRVAAPAIAVRAIRAPATPAAQRGTPNPTPSSHVRLAATSVRVGARPRRTYLTAKILDAAAKRHPPPATASSAENADFAQAVIDAT